MRIMTPGFRTVRSVLFAVAAAGVVAVVGWPDASSRAGVRLGLGERAFAAEATAAPASQASPASRPVSVATLTLDRVRSSPSRIVLANGEIATASNRLEVTRTWNGELCASTIVNRGSQAVRIKEVVLFSIAHDLPPETAL